MEAIIPKQLAFFDKEGRLCSNKKTLDYLLQCKEKVTIVGIVGDYKSGKSTLSNLLAKRDEGFAVGHGFNGKTRGIWAFLVTNPQRRDEKLLFLDTEGLSDVEKKDQMSENACITFCRLVCDIFILNNKGYIKEDVLDKLSASRSFGQSVADIFGTCLPHLVVALKDLDYLKSEKEEDISPDVYLDHILSTEKYNGFMDCFSGKKCLRFGLFDPKMNGKKSQMNCLSKLPPSFSTPLQELQILVYECKGNGVTVQFFAEKVPTLLEALHSIGSGVELPNVLEHIEQALESKMISRGVQYVQEELEKVAPLTKPSEYKQAAEKAKQEAIDMFLKWAPKEKGRLLQKLHEAVQESASRINKKSIECIAKEMDDKIDGSRKLDFDKCSSVILSAECEAWEKFERLIPDNDNESLKAKLKTKIDKIKIEKLKALQMKPKIVARYEANLKKSCDTNIDDASGKKVDPQFKEVVEKTKESFLKDISQMHPEAMKKLGADFLKVEKKIVTERNKSTVEDTIDSFKRFVSELPTTLADYENEVWQALKAAEEIFWNKIIHSPELEELRVKFMDMITKIKKELFEAKNKAETRKKIIRILCVFTSVLLVAAGVGFVGVGVYSAVYGIPAFAASAAASGTGTSVLAKAAVVLTKPVVCVVAKGAPASIATGCISIGTGVVAGVATKELLYDEDGGKKQKKED